MNKSIKTTHLPIKNTKRLIQPFGRKNGHSFSSVYRRLLTVCLWTTTHSPHPSPPRTSRGSLCSSSGLSRQAFAFSPALRTRWENMRVEANFSQHICLSFFFFYHEMFDCPRWVWEINSRSFFCHVQQEYSEKGPRGESISVRSSLMLACGAWRLGYTGALITVGLLYHNGLVTLIFLWVFKIHSINYACWFY